MKRIDAIVGTYIAKESANKGQEHSSRFKESCKKMLHNRGTDNEENELPILKQKQTCLDQENRRDL